MAGTADCMTRLFVTASALLFLGSVDAMADPPVLNSIAWCKAAAAGNAEVEKTCLEREKAAAAELALEWSKLPFGVTNYCRGLTSSVSGAYQTYVDCVVEEMGSAQGAPDMQY